MILQSLCEVVICCIVSQFPTLAIVASLLTSPFCCIFQTILKHHSRRVCECEYFHCWFYYPISHDPVRQLCQKSQSLNESGNSSNWVLAKFSVLAKRVFKRQREWSFLSPSQIFLFLFRHPCHTFIVMARYNTVLSTLSWKRLQQLCTDFWQAHSHWSE